LGLFMVFPVMMLYGRDYIDQTPFLLGAALGIYGLTQAVFQIPLGLLSDVWGRKPVIFIGLIIFALGSAVAAMADSVWGLMIGRALQGAGAIASAVLALVGDLTSEQNRTRAMAVIGASIGLSFAVAMFLGPMLAAAGGLSAIFWVASALAGIGIVILLRAVPNPPAHSLRGAEGLAVPALFGRALKNGHLLRLNFAIFILHFVLTATFVAAPLVLESAGKPIDSHWHYYLPVMLLAFIAMVPLIFVAERKRKVKGVLLFAIVILAVSLFGLALGRGFGWQWLLGIFFFFTAFNLLEATLPSWLSKQAPAGSKGTAMGVYSTCQFLGASVGGFAGGYLVQNFGVAEVFWAAGICCVVWLVVAVFMKAPPYLKSLCVPQKKPISGPALMTKVAGVVECAWVAEQQLLYLKVNDDFEQQALDEYLK
ncbi:MAG TPA: MFS transporter, partial [Marinagarivorans sp.]